MDLARMIANITTVRRGQRTWTTLADLRLVRKVFNNESMEAREETDTNPDGVVMMEKTRCTCDTDEESKTVLTDLIDPLYSELDGGLWGTNPISLLHLILFIIPICLPFAAVFQGD